MYPHEKRLIRGLLVMVMALVVVACGVNVTERTNTGNRYFSSGRYDAALRAYQDAQVTAPDEPRAYFNAAAANVGLEDFQMGVDSLQQALRTANTDMQIEAYYNLGNTFSDMGMYDLAIDAYQKALLLDADHENARYNLEIALLRYVPPSPTAQEQKTEPELSQSDPTVTPTDQPGGFDGPTPTPPPVEFDLSATPDSGASPDGDQDSGTPIPQSQGQMTVEQAELLLEQVQEDQEALSAYLEQEASSGVITEKDW